MATPNYLNNLCVFYIQTVDGDLRAAFMIDGRRYIQAEEVRRDILEAHKALDDRLIIGESEITSIDPGAPAPDLPTWQEYKRQLLPLEKPNL